MQLFSPNHAGRVALEMYSLLNYDKVSVKGKTVKQEGTYGSLGIRTFTAQMYVFNLSGASCRDSRP